MFITAMGMFEGHSQALVQTYTDRCTGQVSVFTVPMNGQTVVAFYNRSRTFTAQEFQNGTLQAWLEETYLWWTALSPCSSSSTGAQTTQQTTQQTTNQATQAATNAAQSTTNVNTNASPPPTSTPPPTQTSQSTTQNTTAPDTTTNQPDTTSTGQNTTSSGDNTTTTGGSGTDTSSQQTETSTDQSSTSETNSTENSTQESSSSESQESTGGDSGNEGSTEESTEVENTSEESTTEESTTEESSTEESTEETSSEESSENEESSNEETDESTEEETTEESSEEESTEEESSEEEQSDESEEESDESSEEDSEEEDTEEESESDEDEESEEEDTEEESNNEDEEEDDKKKKKKRNLAPPIVMANVLSQQMPDGTYSQAAMFGISQSSLMGTETYGLNVMVYDNLKQFMVNANFSKVHINKEGRASRVYSASLGGMKVYTTLMGMMNHSMVWMGKKGSVAGVAFGTTVTTNNVDVVDGNVYFDNQFLGLSLTSFYTKPFNFDRLTVSPMLAVSSPFMMFDMYRHNTMWNKNVMIIAGSNFSYKLTQRFGVNVGVNLIESSANDFPTMKTFTIGGRLSF